MNTKIFLISLLVLCCFTMLSAQKDSLHEIRIKGKVMVKKSPKKDIVVTIRDLEKNAINLLTNSDGEFETVFSTGEKMITMLIKSKGYIQYEQTYSTQSNLENVVIELIKDTVKIEETAIVRARGTTNEVNKKSYKINHKNFLVNAKSTEAIKTIPGFTILNGNIQYENRKNVLIFIDGIESSYEELQKTDLQDIYKIEVIPNPSVDIAGEQNVVIIQVVTKKRIQNFIKGEVETYAAVRLGIVGVSPVLSFKTKKLVFSTVFGYGTNNQEIENALSRNDNGILSSQNTFRKVNGWQMYSSSRLKVSFNTKSILYAGFNFFGYNFSGNMNGENKIDLLKKDFSVEDVENLKKHTIGLSYNYLFNKNANIFFRVKYFNYKNNNESQYREGSSFQQVTSVFSNTKEYSSEIVFNKNNSRIAKLPFNYNTGAKVVSRNFFFQSNTFNLDQVVFSSFLNGTIELNDKWSLYNSFVGEFTNNTGINLKQQYIYFLPTTSLLYKLNDKVNFSLDFGRKITRPGGNFLNPNPIFFDPTYSLVGNPTLLPQVRNSFEIGMQKQINDNSSFSVKVFNERIQNSIIETFTKSSSNIITTYENAGKSNLIGVYGNYATPIFKVINLNVGMGINHNNFSSSFAQSIVRSNKGYSFNSSIYLSTIVRKTVSISLSGGYNNRNISLISTLRNQPEFGIDVETSLFKKKVNLRLNYNDVFALNTKSSVSSIGSNFSQTNQIQNRRTNLTLSITYKFGKVFNDRISNPNIKNEDINNK